MGLSSERIQVARRAYALPRLPIGPLIAGFHGERPGAEPFRVEEALGFLGDRAIEFRAGLRLRTRDRSHGGQG
jgi:hypothetical protein